MAKRKNNKVSRLVALGLIGLVIVSIVITFAPSLGLSGIPTWETIFQTTGANTAAQSIPDDDAPLRVHVMDVGQGDGILIQMQDHAALIDAGPDTAGAGIVQYLKQLGIQKLDYVMVTHPHADHIGGMAAVIEAFPVDTVLMQKLDAGIAPTTRTYTNLLQTIRASGAKVIAPNTGDTYHLGEAQFKIYVPTIADEELNNTSLICRLEYGQKSFLFTGDAEKEAEAEMLKSDFKLQADVLKVGHHGSNTSTSAKFLAAVHPQYAAISCGQDNSYQHPHQKTLKALEKQKVQIYRTDLDGAIVFASDGQDITVHTQNGEA